MTLAAKTVGIGFIGPPVACAEVADLADIGVGDAPLGCVDGDGSKRVVVLGKRNDGKGMRLAYDILFSACLLRSDIEP